MIYYIDAMIVVLNSDNSRSAPKLKMEKYDLLITFSIFNYLILIQCSVLTVDTVNSVVSTMKQSQH